MIWSISVVLLFILGISIQFAWWRATISYDLPRILMYHMISRQQPRKRFNKLRVDPVEFERQVRWLKENGWHFLTMADLEAPFPRKSVVLTFDDGYRDNFLTADPILKKYDARATLYLVVDRHDRDWSSRKKTHHAEGELRSEPKLLDEDVQQMLSSGRWELGGHTLTHDNLLQLPLEEGEREIADCRIYLEEKFNAVVRTFAYPFGLYNESHVTSAQNAGYESAVTTVPGISQNYSTEKLELKRIKVSGHDGLLSFRLRLRTGKCRWKE